MPRARVADFFTQAQPGKTLGTPRQARTDPQAAKKRTMNAARCTRRTIKSCKTPHEGTQGAHKEHPRNAPVQASGRNNKSATLDRPKAPKSAQGAPRKRPKSAHWHQFGTSFGTSFGTMVLVN